MICNNTVFKQKSSPMFLKTSKTILNHKIQISFVSCQIIRLLVNFHNKVVKVNKYILKTGCHGVLYLVKDNICRFEIAARYGRFVYLPEKFFFLLVP